MKGRHFLAIFLFLVIFLGLNSLLGSWFVSWSRADLKDGIAIRRFEEIQDQIDVIFLGDSHVQLSVMAAKIPGGFNFTSGAESYILNYYKAKYYMDGGDFHPEIAVLPIDLHSFMAYRIDNVKKHDPALWNRYVDYLDFGRETNTFAGLMPTFADAYFPLFGGLEVFGMTAWPTDERPVLIEGYLPTDKDYSEFSEEYRRENTRERVGGQLCSERSTVDDAVVAYFHRLIDLFQANGVHVVLVWYPITQDYYDFAGRCVVTDGHLAQVEELLMGREPDLILDYHDLFFGQLEYYSDTDHLNSRGAEILTDILEQDLVEAGLLPAVVGGD